MMHDWASELDTRECAYCGNKSVFVLEWYGYNQYGKNARVTQEIGVCRDFSHMLKIISSSENGFGDSPGGVVDEETLEREYPFIARRLRDVFDAKPDLESAARFCSESQRYVDELLIPESQLTFSF